MTPQGCPIHVYEYCSSPRILPLRFQETLRSAEDDGKVLLFPLPIIPAACIVFFSLPSLSMTQRALCGGELRKSMQRESDLTRTTSAHYIINLK